MSRRTRAVTLTRDKKKKKIIEQ